MQNARIVKIHGVNDAVPLVPDECFHHGFRCNAVINFYLKNIAGRQFAEFAHQLLFVGNAAVEHDIYRIVQPQYNTLFSFSFIGW
jgi:hypothetical protein